MSKQEKTQTKRTGQQRSAPSRKGYYTLPVEQPAPSQGVQYKFVTRHIEVPFTMVKDNYGEHLPIMILDDWEPAITATTAVMRNHTYFGLDLELIKPFISETFLVALLDGNLQLISYAPVDNGLKYTPNFMEIIKTIILTNARNISFIRFTKEPAVPNPSSSDFQIAKRLQGILPFIACHLVDYILLSSKSGQQYSMAVNGDINNTLGIKE